VFVAGLLIGAVTSGVLAGVLGGLVAPLPVLPRLGVLAAALAAVLGFELAGRPLALPQNRRAVPQWIIPRDNVDGPLQFGFEMGTGVRTFMPTALPHAAVLITVLAGGLVSGLLVGLGFGAGRALMPLVRSSRPEPSTWDDQLLDRLTAIGRVTALAFLVGAVVVVVDGLPG
jgi:hypothetical protein